MKTINEERIDAIRMINAIITLKANIFNGCYSDKKELEEKLPNLEIIKIWAIENNQLQEIKHYFASKNFGQNAQFAAAEIASFFND